jgi:hypothetical protein
MGIRGFILLFFLFASFTPADKKPAWYFQVGIMQDGLNIPVTDGVCKLQKKPFQIIIKMSQPLGVSINCSYNSGNYNLVKRMVHIDSLPAYNETGFAEAKKNPGKEILLSDVGYSFWYYDKKEEHRFDNVSVKKKIITCYREINQFAVINGSSIDIKNVHAPVYLTFMYFTWASIEGNTMKRNDLQRSWIKLEWY